MTVGGCGSLDDKQVNDICSLANKLGLSFADKAWKEFSPGIIFNSLSFNLRTNLRVVVWSLRI